MRDCSRLQSGLPITVDTLIIYEESMYRPILSAVGLLTLAACAGGLSVSAPVLIGEKDGLPLWQFSASSHDDSDIRTDAAQLSQDLCAAPATLIDVRESHQHALGALRRWNALFTCAKRS